MKKKYAQGHRVVLRQLLYLANFIKQKPLISEEVGNYKFIFSKQTLKRHSTYRCENEN